MSQVRTFIVPVGWDLTATDLSPGMLDEARANLATCEGLRSLLDEMIRSEGSIRITKQTGLFVAGD